MKIAFLDCYYPQVLTSLKEASSYDARLKALMALQFGTSDFYSEAFQSYGWEAIDIIGNDQIGRELWCKEHHEDFISLQDTVVRQIIKDQPDVLYCQDLSFLSPETIRYLKNVRLVDMVCGQISCRWQGDEQMRWYDLLFTSFPHYMKKFKNISVLGEFLQIGYGPEFSRAAGSKRDLDVTFVGGLGGGKTSGYWSDGTEVMEYVASKIPSFKWWGYNNSVLKDYPALIASYQGEAWGADMYKIYSNSKIVVNRHGEISEGYSNNMRLFEATGSGALLMTEESKNIETYFSPNGECLTYKSKEELVEKLNYYLANPLELEAIADAGQIRTLKDHTYDKILRKAEKSIKDLLNEL